MLCLHGKTSLKCFLIMSCHTYSSSYEHVSGGGFRHLKEVQASDANCTSLISHFIVVKPRETQNLLSWGMKLKIILFTRVTLFPPRILDHSFCAILLYLIFLDQDLKIKFPLVSLWVTFTHHSEVVLLL